MNAKVCTTCLNCSDKMLRCSGCNATSYCNRDCQKKDWHSHKKQCKNLASLRLFAKRFIEKSPKLRNALFDLVSTWAKYKNVDTVVVTCGVDSSRTTNVTNDAFSAEFQLDVRQDVSKRNPFSNESITIELYYNGTAMKLSSVPRITGTYLRVCEEKERAEISFAPDCNLLVAVIDDTLIQG